MFSCFYKRLFFLLLISTALSMSCTNNQNQSDVTSNAIKESAAPNNKATPSESGTIKLTLAEAERLVNLPMSCIQQALPYKAGLTIAKAEDLAMPIVHHPAFYGCFDWHSAVHGHWSIVYLLSKYPELSNADELKKMLKENINDANIKVELDYFSMNEFTKSFERTYGWAWLLKLAEELDKWDDPLAQELLADLQPLADYISAQYIDYLPKLVYPIRVGEHSNTAFGLSFAYDYAIHFNDVRLKDVIVSRAKDFYENDAGCPIDWEPSGYDFLSPCLQEVDLMRKVLPEAAFKSWLNDFLPSLVDGTLALDPGQVRDRSDGKLVHLDGVNFSRAWCLYPLIDLYPDNAHILSVANKHMNASFDNIVGDHYSGGHWLGSFALYALQSQSDE